MERSTMNLSPLKQEILEVLLLHDNPRTAAQVATDIGKEERVVRMNILGLIRTKYVATPTKSVYVITDVGKTALGLPPLTKDKAFAVLKPTTHEKAFHFYAGIGKPLHISAKDLLDFCDKLNQVSVESIEFHSKRGDFENWFTSLGDVELAKKAALLKTKVSGEELRKRLHDTVKNQCLMLSKIVGTANASKP
jgi:hypothetical protein